MQELTADEVIAHSLVWDNHACMPLRPDDATFLPQLERYRRAGFDVVSLNVGCDGIPPQTVRGMLEGFRSWIKARGSAYRTVGSVSDLEIVRTSGQLGICFDLEGGCALEGEPERVELFYDAGVRWMLLAYNRNNELGGGCQDDDTGLTPLGRAVVREMYRVGMVLCLSHTGERTALQAMELAGKPVIFSHSNASAVWSHRRNIPDHLIRACAATGGVIGINGIGIFLDRNEAATEAYVRQIDHVAELVGSEHVGIALDYVFDQKELDDFVRAHPDAFPPSEGYGAGIRMLEPERLPQIVAALIRLGYRDADLRRILGGNWARVARQVWK